MEVKKMSEYRGLCPKCELLTLTLLPTGVKCNHCGWERLDKPNIDKSNL